jgi:hypothetical protein
VSLCCTSSLLPLLLLLEASPLLLHRTIVDDSALACR